MLTSVAATVARPVMDSYSTETEYFQKCRYIHEVELVNMKLQMRILETHLEGAISGRASTYIPSSQILKGISVLSLDFGALRDENLRLKVALADAHKSIRLSQLTEDEDYESDIPSSEDRFRVRSEHLFSDFLIYLFDFCRFSQ
ncbi:unnamed protein product [Haemonchus placei]|uniref:Uncharacterized protein n=1 Tax=Haemonchus placei TaxID=6290 RepID=A0A0N4WYR8_HAEPC|nr:unnamed protein product [Haemonchus placei]